MGCFSRYYNITHISLRGCMNCMYMCTDMVYSKELERDITTRAMAKALLRLNFLASFLHSTRSVRFFTSEGRIRAVMNMACEKCSCSELKLAKHMHTFFVLTLN